MNCSNIRAFHTNNYRETGYNLEFVIKRNLSSGVFGKLLLLFILIPLADLVLLMVISNYTNVFVTISLIVVSGVIGAWLARQQSTRVKEKISAEFQQNVVPSSLLTDGAMILVAAALLITPGLLTDIFGFSLLIPACRGWYKKKLMVMLKDHFKMKVHTFQSTMFQDPDIVDGEVVHREREPKMAQPTKLGSQEYK